jgi:hypothetical protein
MGLLDDYFDPDQFQDSGGLYGRLLSLRPELDSQSGDGTDPQGLIGGAATAAGAPTSGPTSNVASGDSTTQLSANADATQAPSSPFDIGAHLNAGLQKWAQTPVGNPFAALADGIAGFGAVQPTDAAFIGPPAPSQAQAPDFGNRLGAAVQSWAQTPVGSPFAAIANGITGFNTGQSVAPPVSPATQAPTPAENFDDRPNAAVQSGLSASIANANPPLQSRRPRAQWRLPR